MATVRVDSVIFCKNFINRGFCYGLGCKFLHVSREIETRYKRTGYLPTELADEWFNTQKKLSIRDPNICQDQNQSKCFRTNCKFGTHYVFRTDMDVGNIVEFTFRPSPQMMFFILLNMAKVRGRNFTDREKEILVSLIEDHPNKELTTNRNNDKDTSIAKKNFWREIAERFNSASGSATVFSGEQLKNCFKNMITRAKNAQAENKKETIKTGGGQNESEISVINSKVIDVIGDTIKPYDNPFDSDAKFFSQEEVLTLDDDNEATQITLSCVKQSVIDQNKKRKYASIDEKNVFIEKMEMEKTMLNQKMKKMKRKQLLLDLQIKTVLATSGIDYPLDIESTLADIGSN